METQKDIDNIEHKFKQIISGLNSLQDTKLADNVQINTDLSKTDRGAYIRYMADEYIQGKPIPKPPDDIQPPIGVKDIAMELMHRRLANIFRRL